jgi:ribosomal protein S18 acetylase RimI-like enzyme
MMITIRLYRPEDTAGVEQCLIELQDFERSIESNRVEGRTIATARRESLLAWCAQARGALFVAEEAGSIVGLIAVIAQVSDDPLIELNKEFAYIPDLVVLPAYRGRGLGRALLQQAETYARQQGATLLKVDVLAANKVARHLYEAVGFQNYEIRLIKPLTKSEGTGN